MLTRIKKKLGKHFIRGGIFHPTSNYSRVLRRFRDQPGKKIINIGSGGYDPVPGAVNVDPYRGGPGTIRAFGENLPFEDSSLDVVICAAVLEHVKEPEKIVAEAYRVLKTGGELYIEIPFLQPYHAAPEDYHRWTISGLRFLCRHFNESEVGLTNGPGSGLAWILVEYVQLLSDRPRVKFIFKNLMKILVFPLKYIDSWLLKRKNAVVIASGLYFLGKKP